MSMLCKASRATEIEEICQLHKNATTWKARHLVEKKTTFLSVLEYLFSSAIEMHENISMI